MRWDTLRQDIRYTFRRLRHDAGFALAAVLIIGLGRRRQHHHLQRRQFPALPPAALPRLRAPRLDRQRRRGRRWRTLVRHHPRRQLPRLGPRHQILREPDVLLRVLRLRQLHHGRRGRSRTPDRCRRRAELPQLPRRQPELGRNFVDEECTWNGTPAVILTHGLWKRRFASDPHVIGRSVTLNDKVRTIVGVLPASFDFSTLFTPGSRVDMLVPFPLTQETDRWGNTLAVIGRLKPNVTVQQAQAEFDVINDQIRTAHPDRFAFGAKLTPSAGIPHRTIPPRPLRPALRGRRGAAGRLRQSLQPDAGPRRFPPQGDGDPVRAGRQPRTPGPPDAHRKRHPLVRRSSRRSRDSRTSESARSPPSTASASRFSGPCNWTASALLFTLLATLATGFLFGLVPALQISTAKESEALKDAGRGLSESRHSAWTRSILVVSEVAFACILLVGAGLLIRSFLHVLDVDLGFQPERAAAWRIDSRREVPGRRQALGLLRSPGAQRRSRSRCGIGRHHRCAAAQPRPQLGSRRTGRATIRKGNTRSPTRASSTGVI